MPALVKLYIRQVLIGFAIAAGFVAMLLWFNVANLWHLVTHSDVGLIAVTVLWLANGIVFAGVQFGIAIMRMAEDGQGGGGKPARPAPVAGTDPVPAHAPSAAAPSHPLHRKARRFWR